MVGDVREFGLEQQALPEVYRPYAQYPSPSVILARTASDPAGLEPQLRRVVLDIDRETAIPSVQTLDQVRLDTMKSPRITADLLAVFAALALVVAATGIGGIVALSVSQRIHEIGIRLALGAKPYGVFASILRQGMLLVSIGLGIGAMAALVFARLLKGLLFGVGPSDPLTFAGCSPVVRRHRLHRVFDSSEARHRCRSLDCFEARMKKLIVMCAAAILLAGKSSKVDGGAPNFAANGQLVRPADYREWIFVSSGFGMTYGSSSSQDDNPSFDNVFVTPAAYRTFMQTGTWPDKTMFVIEERSSTSHGSINKGGHYQNQMTGLVAEVKDGTRFPGKWAFFSFGESGTAQQIPTTASCYSCHAAHAAVDNTFVQFYPTLLQVAKKKGHIDKSRKRVISHAIQVTGPRQKFVHVMSGMTAFGDRPDYQRLTAPRIIY